VAEKLAIALWAAWLMLSIVVHLPPLTPLVRRWDFLSLVPEWKFFARPPQQDYHLLYRDVALDGSVTGWKEVSVAEPRAWWNFLWNPGRRARKAFFDVITEAARHCHAQLGGVEASVPYLTLLNYISNLPRAIPAQFTQFAILTSPTTGLAREPRVLLTSNAHRL
jgi:hypothetical protein